MSQLFLQGNSKSLINADKYFGFNYIAGNSDWARCDTTPLFMRM